MAGDRFSLEGKVALITGATAGLGRALALSYSTAGAQIAVTGRNAAKNQDMAEQLGGDGLVLALEVRDDAMIEATVAAVVERFGKLDILVNSAGMVVVTEVSSGVPDWLRDEIVHKTPTARWGQPDELAGAALLLAASDYMTGSTVTVDGGYSIAERFRHE